jgi:hypothetical protein
LAIPLALSVHKARSHPRYRVPQDHPLQQAFCLDEKGQAWAAQVLDLSVRTLHLKCEGAWNELKAIRFGGHDFSASKVRRTEAGTVLRLHFKDQKEYGSYFDRFIQIAYPKLRPRAEVAHEALYDLYVSTGYLNRFASQGDPGADE